MNMILLYQSIKSIKQLIGWVAGLVSAGSILRCLLIFYGAYQDPDFGFKEALNKSRKQVFRMIIVICISSFVSWVNSFYS